MGIGAVTIAVIPLKNKGKQLAESGLFFGVDADFVEE